MDWGNGSDVAQAVSSGLSLALTAWIAWRVHRYTKRKDRLDFLGHKWSIQQDINLNSAGDARLALDFERMAYGDDVALDEASARRHFALFLQLNLVQSDWFAYQEDIITLDEFRRYAVTKLNIVARQRRAIEYLVDHRGYSAEFAREVKAILAKAIPPASLPNWDDSGTAPQAHALAE